MLRTVNKEHNKGPTNDLTNVVKICWKNFKIANFFLLIIDIIKILKNKNFLFPTVVHKWYFIRIH